jgi:hypothetical protein
LFHHFGKAGRGQVSAAELLKALETLKLAAETGEFDAQLESAGLKLKSGFTK